MKVQERVMDVTSTLEGEKIAMGIDKDAMVHIMSVLTDLYSDPEMAVIREYSTNAFDSHIEAGINRPIEIQLPTALSPFFRVRDFGVGLDDVGIREIYSQYGASTKRNSNDVVGMLGLGCKSALTYTDQFTVCGVRDGIKTQVSVSRDANGASSMTIVSQEPTNDPNGVEVIVPAKSGNQFQQKARNFFRYWQANTVLVNGEAPERIDGMWIADDILLTTELATSQIVMGNVAYPVPQESLIHDQPNYHYRYKVVSFVKIGTIAFTPSREQLHMTTQTKNTLAELKKRVQAEKDAAMRKSIESKPNFWEAIDEIRESRTMGYTGEWEWHGKKVPDIFEFAAPTVDPITNKPVGEYKTFVVVDSLGSKTAGKYSWTAGRGLNPQQLTCDTLWFEGYEAGKMTPYKRQKLSVYTAQKKVDFTKNKVRGIFVKQIPTELRQFINPKNIHDWATVDAIKIEREKQVHRSDGRPTGSYNGIVGGVRKNAIVASEIKTKNLFWVQGNEWYNSAEWTIVQQECSDPTLITLAGNRIEKFKRDFPTSHNVCDYVRYLAAGWVKKLSDIEKIGVHLSYENDDAFLKLLDASKIDDPAFKKAIQAATLPQLSKLANDYKKWKRYGATLVIDWTNPVYNYPLIESMSNYGVKGKTLDHVYLYINAAYAATKKEVSA